MKKNIRDKKKVEDEIPTGYVLWDLKTLFEFECFFSYSIMMYQENVHECPEVYMIPGINVSYIRPCIPYIWVSIPDTCVSIPNTYVSILDTHINISDTCVSIPDTVMVLKSGEVIEVEDNQHNWVIFT